MSSATEKWTEWETTRRRLVLGGHVSDGGHKPIEGVEIIAEYLPEGRSGKPRHPAEPLPGDGRRRKKIQDTHSRADGSYYFLDLPAGEYRVRVTYRGRRQEQEVTLSADELGIITPRFVNFSME